MVLRNQTTSRRLRSLPPLAGLVALAAGTLTFVGAAGAEASIVAGGAAGEIVNISHGAQPITSGPLPAVSLPPSGRAVRGDAPSVSVRGSTPSSPFQGRFLDSGALAVTSQGSTGWMASTSSASVADVDALGGILTATQVGGSCTASGAGLNGSATIGSGTLVTSGTRTITLPTHPAPNTTFAATTASGGTVTVILNEQKPGDRSITVNAVHLIIKGAAVEGDIVLAQSWCATRPGAPAASSPKAGSIASPTGVPDQAPPGDRVIPAATVASAAGSVNAAVAVPANAGAPAVKGSACAYITNVGLFGGPQLLEGCGQITGTPPLKAPATAASPSVTLPPEGSATAIKQDAADGAKAVYGPATIFGGLGDAATAPPSGPLSASTQGTPGGSVTSTADVLPRTDPASPGGFGPAPLTGKELHVKCTAAAGQIATGSTALVGSTLATATDGEGNPTTTEKVPDSPPVNYTRSGIITNVGDVFTVVYNQQTFNADGSLTVNAVHSYLFGPTAVGEEIIGQVTCGTTPSPDAPKDTRAPTCGTPVVAPISATDPTPMVPLTERIGIFDAGGLQSINNPQSSDGTVTVPPAGTGYLEFKAGQTGPLPISVAANSNDSKTLTYSFDAVDAAGNTTSVSVSGNPPTLVCKVTKGDSGGPADPPGSDAPAGQNPGGSSNPGGTSTPGGTSNPGGSSTAGTGSSGTSNGSKAKMATTGSNVISVAPAGAAMLAAGVIMVLWGRRRRPTGGWDLENDQP